MDKMSIKKTCIISVLALLVIIGVGFSGYKYTKISQYNSLIKGANKYMEVSEYDKAIALFQQSLNYKSDVNIENSIKLAQNLIKIKKIYDEGINLMNNKNYLAAIAQFKKIEKESDKLYTDAQSKINICIKEYISQNINKSNASLKANKYEEANKYIAEIFKVDNNNEEAKTLKIIIDKKIKEAQEKEAQGKTAQKAEEEAKETKATANIITAASAEGIVRNLVLKNPIKNHFCKFDHEENIDGVKYFVIHGYQLVVDHTATWGWYYVNQNNGKVFKGSPVDQKLMN
ncbi:tetratricopeptide repeat protein [Clostridium estertheticum]|uniref:Tetratricopeptide repeat protein n=1 Tax=Clostridium estertheticum TaxID=238834 RepID=A0A7Y3T1E9_9CLOT|nr:tetratricopeptide repeat protein [Clostridium estertheticum]NNU78382.1 tetratricopeptide repeat protein [Clostridium estertheticum]WBL45265.1 tetratricopeptide repeat protein [Clostridium estertheticum]